MFRKVKIFKILLNTKWLYRETTKISLDWSMVIKFTDF